MRDAADELALDDQRIDDPAAVVDHDVAQDADAAGLDVDLDLDRVTAAAIGQRVRQEVLHALQTRLELARHGVARHAGHRFGELAQRHPAAGRARDLDPAVADLEILPTLASSRCAATFSAFSRTATAARCTAEPAVIGLPAGEAALAVRDDGGVAGDHRHGVAARRRTARRRSAPARC